ncbi:MAG TPA: hypothetical protein VF665_10805 [Longimicrobium sp.]|jgi:hypothetical protein|uniref:hypothetical protein n=1 Tax=Longimicrobium sp. TaxID=2029185 RepID=UPI002EDA91FE
MSDSTAATAQELAPPAPRARRGQNGLLSALAGMAVGGGGALLVLKMLPALGESTLAAVRAQYGPWTLPVIVPLALFLAFAVIAVHEAGHVAAGVAAGMRFSLFAAGPLRIDRDPGTGRIAVRFNRTPAFWGGVAGCIPPDGNRIRQRLAWLVGGGPGASLLLAAMAGGLALGVPLPPLARFAAGMLGALSAAIGLATLIPMRTGGFMSDGGRLLRLVRGGPAAERDAAALALVARANVGEAPREWPRELVEASTELRDDTLEESMAWIFAYYHRLDAGDRVAAGRAMHRAMELLDRWPAPLVPAVQAEAAYFAARSGDRDSARAHLAAIPARTASVKAYDRDRALAALALTDGDPVEAAALAQKAMDALPPNTPFAAARLREIIDETTA